MRKCHVKGSRVVTLDLTAVGGFKSYLGINIYGVWNRLEMGEDSEELEWEESHWTPRFLVCMMG